MSGQCVSLGTFHCLGGCRRCLDLRLVYLGGCRRCRDLRLVYLGDCRRCQGVRLVYLGGCCLDLHLDGCLDLRGLVPFLDACHPGDLDEADLLDGHRSVGEVPFRGSSVRHDSR